MYKKVSQLSISVVSIGTCILCDAVPLINSKEVDFFNVMNKLVTSMMSRIFLVVSCYHTRKNIFIGID